MVSRQARGLPDVTPRKPAEPAQLQALLQAWPGVADWRDPYVDPDASTVVDFRLPGAS